MLYGRSAAPAKEPEWKGKISATWKMPWFGIESKVSYLYFGDCEDGEGTKIKGYDLVNVYLQKEITDSLTIYGGAENLLDEENDYFYQTPVQVYAGVRYHF